MPAMVALHCARAFSRIEAIEIGLVLDPRDPFGPGSAVDMDLIASVGPSPLTIHDGRWRWLNGGAVSRQFNGVGGFSHVGQAVGLADLLSLNSCGANAIRVDVAASATATSRVNGRPSHEVIIEITGDHTRHGHGRFRFEIVDPEGYASLSARGVAIVVETLLGHGERPPPNAGLHLPETIVDPSHFVQRLAALGIAIPAD
ncbi:hypothetical protein [Elioraea sp.]|uniref:hypothetical protein n=1 Tax=Elioraea sp. TaxID=2185103 RepID=UPI00260C52F8|nr:hypothetical protein [Elioraea sp.]